MIIGSFVGAGFASGTEINLFFNSYGFSGFLGIFLIGFLFAFLIYFILSLNTNNCTYIEFINEKFSNRLLKKSVFFISISFLLISFFIMVAGFNSYFIQTFNSPKLLGAFIIAIVCFFIFRKNFSVLLNINTILIPIIIFSIFFIFCKSSHTIVFPKINGSTFNAFWACLSYFSYNSILLIPLLFELKKYKLSLREIIAISFFSSVIILIMGLCIFLLLNEKNYSDFELPLLYLSSTINKFCEILYSIVIFVAIFTTAISSGRCFLDNISFKNKTLINFLLCSISIFTSLFGFANLVKFLYPLFGILGFINIIFLLI